MKTLELYYSGPRDPEPKFPYAPSAAEIYEDFKAILQDSGYDYIGRMTGGENDRVTIEVNGTKS